MADGIVASLSGDWAAVVRVVDAVFNGAQFTLLAEDRHALVPPHFEPATSLSVNARLPRGRAFDREREMRWREIAEGKFIVTYLSDSSAKAAMPTNLGLQVSQEQWETRIISQKLYGKWSKTMTDWVEVSVPGVSGKYQSLISINPPPSSLRVVTVDYSRGGIVQMTRFCAVEEYPYS